MLKACLEEERNLLFQLFRIRSYQLTGSQQTTVRFHRSFVQIVEGFPILLIQSQTTQLLCKLLQTCKVRDLQAFARRSSYVDRSFHQRNTLLGNNLTVVNPQQGKPRNQNICFPKGSLQTNLSLGQGFNIILMRSLASVTTVENETNSNFINIP